MKVVHLKNLPPQNIEAETSVLGAVILDGDCFKQALQILTAEDFYREAHRIIFNAMIELYHKKIPIDIVTLSNHLKEGDKLTQVGELPYISSLANSVLTSAHLEYHARIVKEKSLKRKLINMCRKTIDELYEDSEFDSVLSQHKLALFNIIPNADDVVIDTRDIAEDAFSYVRRRHQNRHSISGISSGLKDLDMLTDGFQDGELIIIGARPGMGKSAFAMSLIQNAGVPAGVISLEMSKRQIGLRMLASLSGVNLWQLKKGVIYEGEWSNITEGIANIAELPIYFSFAVRKAKDIEKVILEMVEKKGVKTVLVDYLQLIKSDSANLNREREIAEISNMLKGIAVNCKIPVFAVAQLNRELEKRENKRPTLADLRESGAIEQDADLVLLLYREDYYKTNTPNKGIMEIIVAKGRNTGTGKVKVMFDPEKMQFRDLSYSTDSVDIEVDI